MSRFVYPPEIKKFIADNCDGKYVKELTVIINDKFNTNFTYSQIKCYLHNHGLKTNMFHKSKPRHLCATKYTDEMMEWARQNTVGVPYDELAVRFEKRFGMKVHPNNLKRLCYRSGVMNGRDCRIKPGNVPLNKGTKGMFNVGGNSTSFKKGMIPKNWRPIGSERVTIDGYLEVKVAERTWRPKHILEWEKVNGPVPEGHVLRFIDGDQLNINIENLALITLAENCVINNLKLIKKHGDHDLNMAGINTGKLINAINKKSRDLSGGKG